MKALFILSYDTLFSLLLSLLSFTCTCNLCFFCSASEEFDNATLSIYWEENKEEVFYSIADVVWDVPYGRVNVGGMPFVLDFNGTVATRSNKEDVSLATVNCTLNTQNQH